MKLICKGLQFHRVPWMKELEANLDYQRYKSIRDYEENLAEVMPKMLSSKAFQFIKHSRKKQIFYGRSTSLLRANFKPKGESLNRTVLVAPRSFLSRYRERQMEGFDSVAVKHVPVKMNSMNRSSV